MTQWQTSVTVFADAPPQVYAALMRSVWDVARLSDVPTTATWRCFRRSSRCFLVASWEQTQELGRIRWV